MTIGQPSSSCGARSCARQYQLIPEPDAKIATSITRGIVLQSPEMRDHGGDVLRAQREPRRSGHDPFAVANLVEDAHVAAVLKRDFGLVARREGQVERSDRP